MSENRIRKTQYRRPWTLDVNFQREVAALRRIQTRLDTSKPTYSGVIATIAVAEEGLIVFEVSNIIKGGRLIERSVVLLVFVCPDFSVTCESGEQWRVP